MILTQSYHTAEQIGVDTAAMGFKDKVFTWKSLYFSTEENVIGSHLDSNKFAKHKMHRIFVWG
jgi:hypothetical protein